MPRLIDADALYDNISDLFVEYLAVTSNNEARNIVKSLYKVILDDLVDNAPTASADEVRGRGKWIEDAMRIKCSVCGTDFNDEVTCCSDCYRWPWSYCPICGARLEVSEDD